MASILTKEQTLFLKLMPETPLAKQFYFSGGTALAYYYLQHRRSKDLDFFCQEEFLPQEVTAVLKFLQKKLVFKELDFQTSFNRNLYFLIFNPKKILKLEFTYFPFPQIEKPMLKDGLLIDSLLDIAVNKLFTIAQSPRGRDYFDLYFIIRKHQYSLDRLRLLAKRKFDWHIDPLQLASKLNQVDKHLDDPILTNQIDGSLISGFFKNQAKALKNEIIA